MNATTEPLGEASVADVLVRALRGRSAPARRTLAVGPKASPTEGLVLVASFLMIEDAAVRQAILDAAAILGEPIREH